MNAIEKIKFPIKKLPVYIWILICVNTFIFLFFPVKNILIGVYSWHAKQPETIQGTIEILIVLFIQYLFLGIKNERFKIAGVIAMFLLYLQNHQALVPMLAAVVYFEMIMQIGYALRKYLKVDCGQDGFSYLLDFVAGVALWGTFAIIVSLLGLGTFNHLRLLTIVLFFFSVLKFRRKPMVFNLKETFNNKNFNKLGQFMICILGALILIQCAKSTCAFDYDSLWYGLRPEQVLIGEHSFYDNLGYLEWVNYFPKFIELFLSPLSNLGEYSFIHAGNIVGLILFMFLVYMFMRLLIGSSKKSLFYTIIIFTIPVMTNMASTAKSDLITAFLIVLGAYIFYNSHTEKNFQYVILALTALALSLCGKISEYPYAFMVFVGGILLVIYDYKKNFISAFINSIKKRENIGCFIILILGIFVLFGVTYRTYLLTGYPLYPFTVDFWKKLGFDGVYPFAEYFGGRGDGFVSGTVFNIQFYINHIFNLLFAPNRISEYRANHIAINWYSNFGVYLFIITFIIYIWGQKKKIFLLKESRKAVIALCLPTIVAVVFIPIFMFQYAQDGNYYMVPIVIGVIFGAYLFESSNIGFNIKLTLYFMFCLFILLQSAIMIVSHSSWSWGMGRIRNNLTKSFYDSEISMTNILKSNGLIEIEEYMETKEYVTPRSIGLGYTQAMFALTGGYEDIENSRAMTEGIFDTEENFIKYLDWADINYVILPKDGAGAAGYETDEWKETYSVIWNVYNNILELDNIREVWSEKYRMIDITAYTNENTIGPNIDLYNALLPEYAEASWVSGHYNDGWITKESSFEITTGDNGIIEMIIYSNQDDGKEKNINIYINDNLITTENIVFGENEIEFSVPKNSTVECRLETDFSFNPTNGDQRELSYIVRDIQAS